MKVGYARVSTQDQKLELQTDALTHYGCGQLFKEKKLGKKGGRPAGLPKAATEKARSARILFDSGTKTVEEIAQNLGIGRATCYRYFSQAESIDR
jgi:DNA invertase Pin-like site-specific DNA recombinase